MSLDKEQFLLLKLMEECAEVSKEASKCIQFGLEEIYEPLGISNKERLTNEIKDLLCILKLLQSHFEVRSVVGVHKEDFLNKKQKLNTYLKHSHALNKIEKIEL